MSDEHPEDDMGLTDAIKLKTQIEAASAALLATIRVLYEQADERTTDGAFDDIAEGLGNGLGHCAATLADILLSTGDEELTMQQEADLLHFTLCMTVARALEGSPTDPHSEQVFKMVAARLAKDVTPGIMEMFNTEGTHDNGNGRDQDADA